MFSKRGNADVLVLLLKAGVEHAKLLEDGDETEAHKRVEKVGADIDLFNGFRDLVLEEVEIRELILREIDFNEALGKRNFDIGYLIMGDIKNLDVGEGFNKIKFGKAIVTAVELAKCWDFAKWSKIA